MIVSQGLDVRSNTMRQMHDSVMYWKLVDHAPPRYMQTLTTPNYVAPAAAASRAAVAAAMTPS